MKQNKLGIFLGPGGNMAFYCLGFLDELKSRGIAADLLVGTSASSAIMLETIFNKPGISLKYFGKRLEANKKNFYFLKRPHLPHNDIYKGAIEELLSKYKKISRSKMEWKIITTQTSKKYMYLKLVAATFLFSLKQKPAKNIILSLLRAKERIFSSKDKLSPSDLENIIIGSSTIYPFIKPHFYKGKLLMEGGLPYWNFKKIFKGCDKIIIINPKKGKTKSADNILQIFSTKKVPLNILDYTSKEKIIDLYNLGKIEAGAQLPVIKKYVENK